MHKKQLALDIVHRDLEDLMTLPISYQFTEGTKFKPSSPWNRSTLKRLLSLPKIFESIHFSYCNGNSYAQLYWKILLSPLINKINYRNQLHFYILTTNYLKDKFWRNPIYNSIKTIKYLEINLTEDLQDLYPENYKTLMKEIENDTNGKISCVLELEKLILWKYPYC